jgi:hypothetical protein
VHEEHRNVIIKLSDQALFFLSECNRNPQDFIDYMSENGIEFGGMDVFNWIERTRVKK